MDSALIAFSGGSDSSLLLKVASEVFPRDKLLAVTAQSALYPKEETRSAKRLAGSFHVRHKLLETQELKNRRFVSNPVNRCYICKKSLFLKLKALAGRYHLRFVADGSNASDRKDFRPGSIAGKELGVRSPLAEAGLTKEDIRELSRGLRLSTWDKPSMACLASRIPYGKKISLDILNRIQRAEDYLKKAGFKQVRLRHYNGLCRIEVPELEIKWILRQRSSVVASLKRLGYQYVTLDLEGYRTGSVNEVLRRGVG